MKTAEYYKKYPKKIYISGGSPLQNRESESSVYARELISLGVQPEDIIIEEKSKNKMKCNFYKRRVREE